MANTKKYLITAITLGAIAMASGLLIAGTNLITKDRIAAYEQKKINEGLASIYDVDVKTMKSETAELDKTFDYVSNAYYVVKDENDAPMGYAFKTKGTNSYGDISLIVGFNKDYVYKGVAVVTNGQSFASTLKKNYLDPLVKDNKTVDEVDVSCGATYGAKLTRDMINSATSAAEYLKGANNG